MRHVVGTRRDVQCHLINQRRRPRVYARVAMSPPADGSVETLDSICFVHWSPVPDASEVQRVLDGIVAARRSIGTSLTLVAVVPPTSKVPGREGREALLRFAPVVDRLCAAQYAVFQGSTIRARVVRAFLVAIGLAMHSAVDVVADMEEALRLSAVRLGVDAADLVARARERGLVDP